MLYRIAKQGDYLRADLFKRETAEEAREFFAAVGETALRAQCRSILISVHSSSPLFAVNRSGFLTEFTSLGAEPDHKIALVADTEELNCSHGYFELLGQQHGINVCHFRNEPSALRWLCPPCGTAPDEAGYPWPAS
jgi:hypothetical protein